MGGADRLCRFWIPTLRPRSSSRDLLYWLRRIQYGDKERGDDARLAQSPDQAETHLGDCDVGGTAAAKTVCRNVDGMEGKYAMMMHAHR